MEINTIAVIGAGTMGRGIAYSSAFGRYRTILEDVSQAMLDQGLAWIRQVFDEGVAKGQVTRDQRDTALARIAIAHSVEEACRKADLIIEAVPEDMELKLEIFTLLDKFAKPGSIFATSTSSFSVTELGAGMFHVKHFVGVHFFNTIPKMELLEIVRGLETSEETVDACREMGRRMGKHVVVVRDSPGFITDRECSGPKAKEAKA